MTTKRSRTKSNHQLLGWAVEEVITEPSLIKRLESDKKLVIKLGVDPTSRDLHLGHAVVLEKLRQFQELKHRTILVIGDYTALIGDPAGVNKTRPVLTEQNIKQNMKSYFEQAGKILDLKKTEILYNSHWLSKLTFKELLHYSSLVTVNTLTEREDFAARLKNGQSVGLHEFLYPLLQAIDSVQLSADVELGGWDQRLNLLLGRELQKKVGQKPQELILISPLIGLDGHKKMSSSLNNYIGISEEADQIFGKVMSIPDKQILHYANLAALLTDPKKELSAIKHPRDQKVFIAKKIVERFYSKKIAELAIENFDATFRDKKVAEHLTSELSFTHQEVSVQDAVCAAIDCSRTEAFRLIEQGAIKLDGAKMTDPKQLIDLKSKPLLQVGKHNFRRLSIRR